MFPNLYINSVKVALVFATFGLLLIIFDQLSISIITSVSASLSLTGIVFAGLKAADLRVLDGLLLATFITLANFSGLLIVRFLPIGGEIGGVVLITFCLSLLYTYWRIVKTPLPSKGNKE